MATASQALAGPPDDVWNLVNSAHVAAGCASYGGADQLRDLSVDYAKSMAQNGGRTQTTSLHVNTDELLTHRGYTPAYWGEMDYYNPGGQGSAQAAFDYWQSHGLSDLMRNCDITQLGVGVWIVGKNWAASAIMGTPQ